MNGEVCCILQVCCPPERAKKALADEIAKTTGDGVLTPELVADFIIDTFDLAPKGLLQPLLKRAGDLAKAHPHDE